MSIRLNADYINSFINDCDYKQIQKQVKSMHEILHSEEGISKNTTGWLSLPTNYDINEFNKIKEYSNKVRADSDILLVIGIGGSYLGSRAAIEFLHSPKYNLLSKNSPKILFAGNNMSSDNLKEILLLCEDKDVSVNVISKSGTTTEPAIAFRIIKEFMEKKYSKIKAKDRIYCTTDRNEGTLRKIVNTESYHSFEIPADIGGRFSVLSSVGLFPIAVSGSNIEKIMFGAKSAQENFMSYDIEKNDAYKYAVIRNTLYLNGKYIEILSAYEPRLSGVLEWWKQLYSESEGKSGKGIFPTSAVFTTDLHSMGQFIQEGSKIIFETSILIKNAKNEIIINEDENNIDNLNFLSGKSLSYVNRKAFEGTLHAHMDGGVPNILIEIEDNSEYQFGELIYFFEKSCAMSGLLLGVNPFNQPGVERYKNNMFELLGKPGYV